MFLCQSGIWPILCQLMAILAKLLNMDFKIVFHSIYIDFDMQTNFEVNQTQISHYIPKILQKVTKMAISQIPILPKCHSSKSPANFGFWAQIFFGGLNQKSASISMCKIHIYIDSECFRQIH